MSLGISYFGKYLTSRAVWKICLFEALCDKLLNSHYLPSMGVLSNLCLTDCVLNIILCKNLMVPSGQSAFMTILISLSFILVAVMPWSLHATLFIIKSVKHRELMKTFALVQCFACQIIPFAMLLL